MPNWCNNTLTVSINSHSDIDLATKELQQFIQVHNCVYDSDEVEYPQELIRIPIDFTKENLPDIHFSFSGSLPIPIDEENNWYKWCNVNWGTKWDVNEETIIYDISTDYIEYQFETAWCPPSKWLENIYKNYPLLDFKLISDEAGSDFHIEIYAGYEDNEPYFHSNEISYIDYIFENENVISYIHEIRDYLIKNGKKIIKFMAYIEENRELLNNSYTRFIVDNEEILSSKTLNDDMMLLILEYNRTLDSIINENEIFNNQELTKLLELITELFDNNENNIEYYLDDLIKRINISKIYSSVQKIGRTYKTSLFRRCINGVIKKSRINRELIEFSMFHPSMLSISVDEGWYHNLPFKLVHNNTSIYTHSGYLVRELEIETNLNITQYNPDNTTN